MQTILPCTTNKRHEFRLARYETDLRDLEWDRLSGWRRAALWVGAFAIQDMRDADGESLPNPACLSRRRWIRQNRDRLHHVALGEIEYCRAHARDLRLLARKLARCGSLSASELDELDSLAGVLRGRIEGLDHGETVRLLHREADTWAGPILRHTVNYERKIRRIVMRATHSVPRCARAVTRVRARIARARRTRVVRTTAGPPSTSDPDGSSDGPRPRAPRSSTGGAR